MKIGGELRKRQIFLAFCQRHKMSTSPYSGCGSTFLPSPIPPQKVPKFLMPFAAVEPQKEAESKTENPAQKTSFWPKVMVSPLSKQLPFSNLHKRTLRISPNICKFSRSYWYENKMFFDTLTKGGFKPRNL